jgi:arylsulfatase
MYEGRKGGEVVKKERIDYEFKIDVDRELNRRSLAFMERCADANEPFFIYHNHSLLHLPVVPRDEYKGASGHGDWADCLLELDGDFGLLLDKLDELGLRDNTIVIFAGDNGNEEVPEHRGTAGFWEGSYFTGMEGSLRTPCIVRWPGRIPQGVQSNEIMHCCDWFTTLAAMIGLSVPDDRIIDGVDQTPFLVGDQVESNREGFLYWNADQLYGVKWHNFKVALKQQKYLSDPALDLPFPAIINLDLDPKEREPFSRYLHTWVIDHVATLMRAFAETVEQEELIAPGAPVDFVPTSTRGNGPGHESATVRPG